MQMIPELAFAMLACTRIGAVHSIVFGAFSPDALRNRINDSSCKVLITQDTGVRGTKQNIPMKSNADIALQNTPSIENVFVVKRTREEISMQDKRDLWWDDCMDHANDSCPPIEMDAEDPLFILYTSGSTGKPKGILHTTGGYLVYASYTHEMVFDYQPGDIYWCTADIGWITGHSYIIYGHLTNRATTLMFEGVPNYPDFGRFWNVVEKHKVNIFYTAPTALRALMREGNNFVNNHDRSSLKLLGTVGEPINPKVWIWYFTIIGKSKCPIIDTWWQTETGGMMLSPLPGLESVPLKPGSATRPIPGVDIDVVDENGNLIPLGTKGYLVIKRPWPGMLLTLWGDDKKYKDAYWSKYEYIYYSGDYALKDSDGYFWLLGRADDMLKVAGHRIGTAELESSLVSHNDVAEAAVCGIPDKLKGESIIAFVVLKQGVNNDTNELKTELIQTVRKGVGPIATPDQIYFVSKLPKTRSGKIMSRLLKAIISNDKIGDLSTLEDGSSVTEIQTAFNELQKSVSEN